MALAAEKDMVTSERTRLRLQSLARGVSGNYRANLVWGPTTCTDGKTIWLNPTVWFSKELDPVLRYAVLRASAIHEALHILLTAFHDWKRFMEDEALVKRFGQRVVHAFANALEDSRIELIGSHLYAGARKWLRLSNLLAVRHMEVAKFLTDALVQGFITRAVAGVLPPGFAEAWPQVVEYLDRVEPIIQRGRRSGSTAECLQVARECLEAAADLLPEEPLVAEVAKLIPDDIREGLRGRKVPVPDNLDENDPRVTPRPKSNKGRSDRGAEAGADASGAEAEGEEASAAPSDWAGKEGGRSAGGCDESAGGRDDAAEADCAARSGGSGSAGDHSKDEDGETAGAPAGGGSGDSADERSAESGEGPADADAAEAGSDAPGGDEPDDDAPAGAGEGSSLGDEQDGSDAAGAGEAASPEDEADSRGTAGPSGAGDDASGSDAGGVPREGDPGTGERPGGTTPPSGTDEESDADGVQSDSHAGENASAVPEASGAPGVGGDGAVPLDAKPGASEWDSLGDFGDPELAPESSDSEPEPWTEEDLDTLIRDLEAFARIEWEKEAAAAPEPPKEEEEPDDPPDYSALETELAKAPVHSSYRLRVYEGQPLPDVYRAAMEATRRLREELYLQLKPLVIREPEFYEGGRRRGSLDTRRLWRAPALKDPHVFGQRRIPYTPELAVYVLADSSGSMSGAAGGMPSLSKADAVRLTLVSLADVLERLGIPHAVSAFDESSGSLAVNHYRLIRFGQKVGREAVVDYRARANNRDGYSIRVAVEELRRRRERVKLLFVLSDGQPAALGYGCRDVNDTGVVDTRMAVQEARNLGIEVLGFYFGSLNARNLALERAMFGTEHLVVVTHLGRLAMDVAAVLRRVITRYRF